MLMGGQVSRRKRLGNPAAKPPDHIIFENNSKIKINEWKNYVVRPSFPLVLLNPLVFFAGEPKDVFSAVLAYPFTSIIVNYIAKHNKLVLFSREKRAFFVNLR